MGTTVMLLRSTVTLTQKVSKLLVFYAQSTSAVISGRINTEKVGPNNLENINEELKFKEYVRLG